MTHQRDAFTSGEGDAWFERNQLSDDGPDRLTLLLADHVLQGGAVLEVGCADGRQLAALSSLVSARYVGVDPSHAAISAGTKRWTHLELRTGTADDLSGLGQFDLVIIGFCLYLCDRESLPRIVAEVDRSLTDGGTLAIVDFDPPLPTRRPYRHREGLFSFKMDYSRLFTAHPAYSLVSKHPFSHSGDRWVSEPSNRLALWILQKRLDEGYAFEPDR